MTIEDVRIHIPEEVRKLKLKSSNILRLPKYTEKECLERRISLSIPLKVRFVLNITDEDDRSKYVQSIEQDVFFGNIPYMTQSGTFIINGAERVIVSQLQRSPGVFFDQNFHPNGTKCVNFGHTFKISPLKIPLPARIDKSKFNFLIFSISSIG